MNGFPSKDTKKPADQVCCLVDDGYRCHRFTGNASYSKRIQKIVAELNLKLLQDLVVHHTYICDYHKGVIQKARKKADGDLSMEMEAAGPPSSQTGESNPEPKNNIEVGPVITADLRQLPVNALRRYKRTYHLQTKSNGSKTQLAEACTSHFNTIPVNEAEIISKFFCKVKNGGDKNNKQKK